MNYDQSDDIVRYTDVAMYPTSTDSVMRCTAVLMANRAQPEWIQVPCAVPISLNVVCSVKNTTIPQSVHIPDKKVFHKSCIVKHEDCFLFLWHRKADQLPQACLTIHNVPFKLDKFWFLFDAVEVVFPPLFNFNMTQTFTYRKHLAMYENVWEHSTKTSQALYVCIKESHKFVQGGNIFLCGSGQYISSVYVCDGQLDCTNNSNSDEVGCSCEQTGEDSPKCKYLVDTVGNKTCSVFYYRSREHSKCNKFNLFGKQRTGHATGTKSTNDQRVCHSGQFIQLELVDDMIGDCVPYAEDEMLLIALSNSVKITAKEPCTKDTQIPCRTGTQICYDLFQICTYQLNQFDRLIPCSTGEHLQSCKQFECNMLFKCQNFYCIPWKYVDDGMWDCPNGADEVGGHFHCKSLFRCSKSSVCVHLGQVCDHNIQCPHGEDEHLCDLHALVCPSSCTCHTYVLTCNGVESWKSIAVRKLPHYILHIKKSAEEFVYFLLSKVTRMVSVTITHNGLKHIRTKQVKMTETLSFDAAHNSIAAILNNCFGTGLKLKIILLNNNNIVEIEASAFYHLAQLIYLNIQNNLLANLPNHITTTSPAIKLLDIRENSLQGMTVESLQRIEIRVIRSSSFPICCVLPSNAVCTQKLPWHTSCHPLLQSLTIKFVFYCLSSFIILANILSILLHSCPKKKANQQGGEFQITLSCVNGVDLVCGIFLCVVWAADLGYGQNFVTQHVMWTGHIACFCTFGAALLFHWCSPVLICFVSYSRLSVVVHPLDSQVKDILFVSKILAAICGSCLLLAITITVVLKAVFCHSPNKLCSPLFDTKDDNVLIHITIWITFVLQLISSVSVCIVYSLLVSEIELNRKKLASAVSKKTSSKGLIAQLVLSCTFNALCWIPTGVVCVACFFLHKYPLLIEVWTTVAVTTINSVADPVVIIITTVKRIHSEQQRSCQ